MPELPEVQTTVDGLNETVVGKTITDVWTNYKSSFKPHKHTVKDVTFFNLFKKEIISQRIVKAERIAKNILIHLSNKKIILIHMKMTGHLLYGTYVFNTSKEHRKDPWKPSESETQALKDPFNRHIRLVFSLSNHKHLSLSDMRKFAKVTLIDSLDNKHLSHIGPDPLSKEFTFSLFVERISKKPTGPIKSVLMDQTIIAGVGNIYSDEALWLTGLHPEEKVKHILHKRNVLKKLHESVILVLKKGIDFGGDSMSDYRNIKGERGLFQGEHNAYRKTGDPCKKRGCNGTILRKVVRGRSAHFCSMHQKML
ncbi:MAG: bifunctional DNA-formamidopyrimidine glycosylase/DNA-(apurinic or apyrimidinic site) lyase [Candidatus Taylorbacteria bacterium]|nr:bifunctional DNA-formamidopyrimidine glycosylase/DNA-(apurinic or apyrimidinic site) lyase [Candidatus Taylorbacteria bacterium]